VLNYNVQILKHNYDTNKLIQYFKLKSRERSGSAASVLRTIHVYRSNRRTSCHHSPENKKHNYSTSQCEQHIRSKHVDLHYNSPLLVVTRSAEERRSVAESSQETSVFIMQLKAATDRAMLC
jgi:hypothetical protein